MGSTIRGSFKDLGLEHTSGSMTSIWAGSGPSLLRSPNFERPAKRTFVDRICYRSCLVIILQGSSPSLQPSLETAKNQAL